MSVVACRVADGVSIASDSITVRGWTQRKGDNTSRSKLFECDGIIVGTVGYSEDAALMHEFLKTHKPAMATDSAILTFVIEFADWKKSKTESRDMDRSEFIFCMEGKAFRVHNFYVEDIKTFTATGAGAEFAMAALHLGKTVEEAVETAIELSVYCEGPVRVLKQG